MKISLQTILFLLICSTSFSQHTDRFKDFTANIKPIKSKVIDIKFNNGKQKELGVQKTYQHGNYQYEMFTGKYTKYYRNGNIKSIDVFDLFGNLISTQLYDNENTPYCHLKTLKIDTEAKNIDEFFNTEEHLTIEIEAKIFKFYLSKNDWILHKEGNYLNGTENGKWIIYNKDGSVKKMINY